MTTHYNIRRQGQWVRVTEEEFRAHQSSASALQRSALSVQRSALPGSAHGLGDLVHAALAPLVRGTRFENCTGCAKRRAALNALSRKVASSE